MIRGSKTNRLEGTSSPISEVLSVKAESLKEDNKMKKRNYIISKMKEMGFSAKETFYFMKAHGLDKSYEIIEWCFSSCVKCGKS